VQVKIGELGYANLQGDGSAHSIRLKRTALGHWQAPEVSGALLCACGVLVLSKILLRHAASTAAEPPSVLHYEACVSASLYMHGWLPHTPSMCACVVPHRVLESATVCEHPRDGAVAAWAV
jgi:hypothetical protein